MLHHHRHTFATSKKRNQLHTYATVETSAVLVHEIVTPHSTYCSILIECPLEPSHHCCCVYIRTYVHRYVGWACLFWQLSSNRAVISNSCRPEYTLRCGTQNRSNLCAQIFIYSGWPESLLPAGIPVPYTHRGLHWVAFQVFCITCVSINYEDSETPLANKVLSAFWPFGPCQSQYSVCGAVSCER